MKFTKMHGCGNDYVYVNCFNETIDDPARLPNLLVTGISESVLME